MGEGAVSRRLALWLLEQPGTGTTITLCLDGNQIAHFETEHFANRHIDNEDRTWRFTEALRKKGQKARWPGVWQDSARRKIVVTSTVTPKTAKWTTCDLEASTQHGKIRVECKGANDRTARIHLQEAIGQVVTIRDVQDNEVLAVALPYSPRLQDLAEEFLNAPIFGSLNIVIALVHHHDHVEWWRWNGQIAECVSLTELWPTKKADLKL